MGHVCVQYDGEGSQAACKALMLIVAGTSVHHAASTGIKAMLDQYRVEAAIKAAQAAQEGAAATAAKAANDSTATLPEPQACTVPHTFHIEGEVMPEVPATTHAEVRQLLSKISAYTMHFGAARRTRTPNACWLQLLVLWKIACSPLTSEWENGSTGSQGTQIQWIGCRT